MRKLSGLITLLLVSIVLVSCSVGEDDEPASTDAPTSPPVSTRISEPTADTDVGIPGTPAFEVAGEATPATADGTPAEEMMATPEGATMPASIASPIASPVASPSASPVATPQVDASPEATPMAASGMIVPPAPEPTEPPMMIELKGTIVLNGNENEAYVLTDEGCIGLGTYEGLHGGRQVVVRDERGTIVSVTTLETVEDAGGCAWEFVASVPESEFYAISIPMEFEQVFPGAMVAESNGEVTIELP